MLAGIAAFALAPFAAADLEKYLPNGETLALAKIENLSALNKSVEKDPFIAELTQKVLLPAFESAAQDKADESCRKLKAFSQEFLKYCTEEVLLACVANSSVFIADCEPGLTPQKLADLLQAESEEIKDGKTGAARFNLKLKKGKISFSINAGKLVATSDLAVLDRVLAAIADENAQGLQASPAFQKALASIGDAHAWVYADGAAIAKAAYKAAADADKRSAEEAQKNPGEIGLTIPITPIVKALAPEAFDSFVQGYFVGEDKLQMQSVLSWNAEKGLVKLIAGNMKPGIKKPAFFPDRSNFAGVSYTNWSLGKALQQVMEIGREATPMFVFVEMQMQSLKELHGIDIPAVLASIGNGAWTYTVANGTDKNTIFIQNVSDKKIVLDAVRKLVPPGSLKEIPGKPVVYSAQLAKDQDIAFAFVGEKLCVGPTALLQSFLNSRGKEAVWKNKSLCAAEAQLPKGGSGFSYAHVGKSWASALEFVKENAPDRHMKKVLGSIVLTESDLDYSVVSKTYLRENALRVHTIIVSNKDAAAR